MAVNGEQTQKLSKPTKMHEKYLEVLKTFTNFITTKEWAIKFDEIYPSETKEEYDITIRKIEKSISSLVTTGKWSNMILIDKNIFTTSPLLFLSIQPSIKINTLKRKIIL